MQIYNQKVLINKERPVRAMGATMESNTITLDQREAAGLSTEEEQKIVNILINSSLFLEMSPSDRKRLVRYLLTMYY